MMPEPLTRIMHIPVLDFTLFAGFFFLTGCALGATIIMILRPRRSTR
jgi:hypothetical protein